MKRWAALDLAIEQLIILKDETFLITSNEIEAKVEQLRRVTPKTRMQ
jgi:hypothetical protein